MKFWYEFILDYYSFLSILHTEQHFVNLFVVSLEKGEVFNATYNFVFAYIWLYWQIYIEIWGILYGLSNVE